MSQGIHLSVDVMGGDYGSRFCILAVLELLQKHDHVRVTLFGSESEVYSLIPADLLRARVHVVDCSDAVSMNDSPSYALRHRQSSSMWLSLQALNNDDVDACVSAGNTVALVAMSHYLVKTLNGIKRPAIAKAIPNSSGVSLLLDLGANLVCSANQLAQFAIMGHLFAKSSGVSTPKVGILNVGREKAKGSAVLQSAYTMLERQSQMNFIGFVEGDDIFSGRADVIVCDGYVGNVALKSSEGAAQFLISSLRQEFQQSLLAKVLGYLVRPVLMRWLNKYSPSRFNGAVLLGLQKIVVKSHGGAKQQGFLCALETALEHCEKNTSELMRSHLSSSV